MAFVGGFVLNGSRSAFAVQYPAMSADVGWTATELTVAFGLAMPLYAAALVGAGFAVDRFGVRSTLLTGLGILTASCAVAALASELWQVYLAWGVLLGLGQAGVGFVPMIKAAMTLAPARLGVILGFWQLGQGLGVAFVTPALALLDDRLGWRGAQAVAALALLAIVVLAAAVVHVEPSRRGPAAHDAAPVSTRVPAAFWPLLLMVTVFGLWFIVTIHQVAHLQLVGLGAQEAASIAGLTGLGTIGGAIALGWAIPRVPILAAIAVSLGLLAIGTFALAAVTPAATVLIAVYVLGVGCGRGATGVTLSWLEGRLIPAARLGRYVGFLEASIGATALAGPVLAASWRDSGGSYVPGMVLAGIAVLVSGACAAAAVWASRRRPENDGPAPVEYSA